MKKWIAVLLSAMLVLSMTACGAKESGGKTEAAAKEKKAPTVDELLQKTTDASKNMKSFSADIQMKQNIEISQGEQKQNQKVEMKMKTDITKDPLQMYQEIKMSVPNGGDQEIKQYITQKGIYSFMDGSWKKIPDSMKDEMLKSIEGSANPEKQLEQIKSAAKDMKVAEEGNNYILTADLSGENMKELAKSFMSDAENKQMAAMIEQMNIKSIKLKYSVDKEKYLPTKSDVNMTMEMEQSGQKISFDMEMTSTVSKHNEVGEITVPKEVLDSAK